MRAAAILAGGQATRLHGAAKPLLSVGGRLEPLHARYARSLLDEVRARLDRGERSLVALLEAVDLAIIDEPALRAADPTLLTLANVNTPEDLARLAALAVDAT